MRVQRCQIGSSHLDTSVAKARASSFSLTRTIKSSSRLLRNEHKELKLSLAIVYLYSIARSWVRLAFVPAIPCTIGSLGKTVANGFSIGNH
jgi:hypothetical protein